MHPILTHPKGRQLRLEQLEDRRLLAVFTVSNLDDTGAGSLRKAIDDANATPAADEIQFSVTGTINIASQLPTITKAVTITGPGQELLTIDAGNGADNTFATGDGYRIFDIDDGDTNNEIGVEISGLTLTGRDTVNGIDSPIFSMNAEGGGAIRSAENLSVVDSAITGNATGDGGDGGGSGGDGGSGGGISSSGTLTVTGSSIVGNTTGDGGYDGSVYGFGGDGGNGGGILTSGTTTITDSTISGNTTGNGGNGLLDPYDPYGGGIGGDGGISGGIISSGTLAVTDSSSSGNTTGYGGIASNHGNRGRGGGIGHMGTTTITSSTISGNSTSTGSGGGIYSNTDLYGQTTTISNSTISDNTAGWGGGVFNVDGLLILEHSTIIGNSATAGSGVASWGTSSTTTTVGHSVIAGNVTSEDVAVVLSSINPFTSNGYNLIGTGADFDSGNQNALDNFIFPGDQTNVIAPLLGSLADNGGPTETHALLPGSPAIDAGDPSILFSPTEFDQRDIGFPRVVNGPIDIGAIEVQFIRRL